MANIYLEKEITIIVVLLVGSIFIFLGYLNFQKFQNKVQFIVGRRDENIFSLTTTLTASALALGFFLDQLLQQRLEELEQ